MSVERIEVKASQEVLAEWKEHASDFVQHDEGMTAQELAVIFKVSVRAAQSQIREGLSSGKYVQGWQSRVDAAGRRCRVPVYRVAKEKKK